MRSSRAEPWSLGAPVRLSQEWSGPARAYCLYPAPRLGCVGSGAPSRKHKSVVKRRSPHNLGGPMSKAPQAPGSGAPSPTRRKFIAGAAGASALAFPMISKGQTGPINMRFQSTWPSKDIFHEYALDYAKTVNDMTGGDLKIEVLPAGA